MLRKLIPLATVGCLTFVGLPSEAVTHTVVNGTTCQSVYPPNSSLGTDLAYAQGRITNQSSGFRYVMCPLVRTQGRYGSINDLEVSLNLPNANSGSFCQAIAVDRYSANAEYETITENGSGNQLLDFGSIADTDIYEGSYYVFCSIAAGVSVTSIVLDEVEE